MFVSPNLCKSSSQLPRLLLCKKSNHFRRLECLADGCLNCLAETEIAFLTSHKWGKSCVLYNHVIYSSVKLSLMSLNVPTSCIPLSSSTRVMSPVIIFFRESLNSPSCSRVSLFVSSYSSSSSSSLEKTNKQTNDKKREQIKMGSDWFLQTAPAILQVLKLLHQSVELLFHVLP